MSLILSFPKKNRVNRIDIHHDQFAVHGPDKDSQMQILQKCVATLRQSTSASCVPNPRTPQHTMPQFEGASTLCECQSRYDRLKNLVTLLSDTAPTLKVLLRKFPSDQFYVVQRSVVKPVDVVLNRHVRSQLFYLEYRVVFLVELLS